MIFESTASDGLKWIIVYDKAKRPDGTLLFPERLSEKFLDSQRLNLGSYIYANQYQNEIIPDGAQDFKKEWLKYYEELPKEKTTFAFIDPAISLENEACYTAIVIVDIDLEGTWYLKVAKRARITATATVKLIFDIHRMFKPQVIGVEVVAYQKALMHFLDEEMRKSKTFVPVQGINRGPEKSKSMRIRSLVPRFEWGRVLIKPGLTEFEDEYSKFPRGNYVDILDALASIEDIAYMPHKKREESREPAPNHPDYEKWYIRNLITKKAREADESAN